MKTIVPGVPIELELIDHPQTLKTTLRVTDYGKQRAFWVLPERLRSIASIGDAKKREKALGELIPPDQAQWLAATLWGMLLHKHSEEEVTYREVVASWPTADEERTKYLVEKISEAISVGTPEGEQSADPPRPKRSRRRRSASSVNGKPLPNSSSDSQQTSVGT